MAVEAVWVGIVFIRFLLDGKSTGKTLTFWPLLCLLLNLPSCFYGLFPGAHGQRA